MDKIEKIKSPDFLSGGGEMGDLIRKFDWANNPLGDPRFWESSLKTCVRIMLASSQPIWIGWGKQLIKLYNDAYIDIVRGKHPLALGQPASVVWKDIWKQIEPMLAKAMKEDEGTYSESQLLIMERSGYPEETYYTFSYTPVLGDDGKPAGIICYNVADTERIIHERTLNTLQQLDSLAKMKSEADVYDEAARALETNSKDFPFAIIYKINEDGSQATAVARAGISKDHPEIPAKIDLAKPGVRSKNISKAVVTSSIVESTNDGRWKNLPMGSWDVMPHSYVHVPIVGPHKKFPLAILSIGLNPYRKFDDTYRNFAQLIADRISLGVNNVIAYEEERKRAEALEEIDKAKTIFFSNISHEFRTPLTLMLGTIEEALNEPAIAPRNKERLNVTHRNAMRLLKLVNTLLDFSRIESGRQRANYALLDLARFTKNLAGNFRSIIEKAGLKFEVRADAVIKPVYVDKQMWEKIVFNLLSNAFKYTLNGEIIVKLFSGKTHAVLQVTDTGTGIPADELPHMFERFHRVRHITGRTYEGTGIGLSLTKELVELHGGMIDVVSEVGKGSTFTVRIPFGREHLPVEQTTEVIESYEDVIADAYIEEAISLIDSPRIGEGEEMNPDRSTVMVVDDNADMRQHIQSILQRHFNVITAANGMEALHKISSGKPALILTDIMMPIMDGIQLLKAVKENIHTRHIPVILLTARAGEESKLEGFETGADDYLVKPFSANELYARIKAQVDISKKRTDVENKLKDFLMQAPAAIAILETKDYVFTLANPLFEKTFGTPGRSLMGRTVKEAFPEAAGQGIFELFDSVFTSGKPFIQHAFPASLNINDQLKTGYYDFILQPLKNEKQQTTGIMAHVVDTTESVLASKKIEQNAETIRNMYMNAPAFVAVFKGPEHVYELVNPYYQSVIGNRDVIGKKLLDALPELKGQGIDVLFDQVYKEGITVLDKERLVMLARHPGQEPEKVYFDYSFQPIYDDEGKITGVLAFGIDITAQVTARKKIQESENQFRNVLLQSPGIFAILKGPDMVLTFGNEPLLNSWGKTWDIIGKKLLDVLPELKGQPFPKLLSEVYETGKEIGGLEGKAVLMRDGVPVERFYDYVYQPIYDEKKTVTGITIMANDVTEQVLARKKIEERERMLRQTKEQLELSIAAGKIGVWHWDVRHNVLTWNKEQFEMFGVDPGNFKGTAEDFFDFIIEEDREKINAASRQEFEHSGNQYEFRIKRKDGAIRWIQSRSSTLMDSKGNPEYITGINIDLTEQVMARKKIEESEKELQALFMQAPVSIILFEGEEFIAKVANAAALRIIGLSSEEVINRSLFEFFPDLPQRTNIYSQVYQTGVPYEGKEVEITFKRRGQVYSGYFDLNYSPWKDSNGNINGVMSVGVEVTEKVLARKKIENISAELEAMVKARTAELEQKNIQLEDVQSFLRQVVDSSIEFISVLDKDLRFMVVNKKFEEGLALSREFMEGKSLFEINPRMQGTFHHECILKALNGQTIHLDKRRSVDRPDLYVDTYFIPLIIQNKVEGVIIMARDVTDIVSSGMLLEEKNTQLQNSLNQLEALFRKLQDQKLKDEQKDDFILMASHELKTPVTTIKGYVQLLNEVRAASGKSDASMDKTLFDSALKTIDKQINKLTSLISELLDLSKIEKGQLELFQTTFELAELVRDVVQDVQYTTQHKIQLTIRTKDNVSGDKDRLMQVLINLITNAVKYSPGADKIGIEVYREKNGMAAVTVKDYGIGIDKADHEKIFERFYRVEGRKEKTFPGFGIGLFIANDIIKRHSGEIRVRSEKNKGSEFTFLLPVAKGK